MLRTITALWMGTIALVLITPAAPARGARPVENLLPAATKGLTAVPDMPALTEKWNATQWGQLVADPIMKPFREDLRKQIDARMTGSVRLGLKLEDFRGVAGGEVGVALVAPQGITPSQIVVADVTGHLPQAAALLEKIDKNLGSQGAKRSMTKVPETQDPVIRFDVPVAEEQRRAPRNGVTQPAPVDTEPVFYCLTQNYLLAAEDLRVLRDTLSRLPADQPESLADSPAFKMVMARCAQDNGGRVPQLRWFMVPLDYFEASQATTPESQRLPRVTRRKKSNVEIFRENGFEAMQGAGGYMDLLEDGYEMLHRTAVYAPQPYRDSMRMMKFPNGKEFAPQSWVPRDVSTYATFYIDVVNAFDHVGPMFDAYVGQGQEGIWEEVLAGLKEDPQGPKIDLREELVVHLGNRVTILTDYVTPIAADSERNLYAIEAKDPAQVRKAVKKIMDADKTVRQRKVGNEIIWEVVQTEGGGRRQRVRMENVPKLVPDEFDDEFDEEEEQERIFPNVAVGVVHGQLMIASHPDMLIKVLQPLEARETLARAVDFRIVDAELSKLGLAEQCGRAFSRTDEELYPSYELFRQGKLPSAQTMFAKLLNNVLNGGKNSDAPRKAEFQGQQLPAFDAVRNYLGPDGTAIASEPNGWFFKGIMLKKL